MIRKLLLALSLALVFTASADAMDESCPQIESSVDGKVYDVVEEMPQLPGGRESLLEFIASHLQYPKEAQENGVQGRVVVKFIVTDTGKVTDTKVIRGKDPLLDAEAIRVVNELPEFIPGKMNGQPVNVWYTLPIQFKL